MIRQLAIATIIAIAAGVALPSKSEAAGNLICKSMTWGHGKHSVRPIARAIAANNWRTNAGPAWSKWSLAKSRSKLCRKEGTLWNCVRKAKPCRKLGLGG